MEWGFFFSPASEYTTRGCGDKEQTLLKTCRKVELL